MDINAASIRVPGASIAAMVVTALIAIGVPIALCIFIRKKYKAKISSFFIGCGTFILFALVLEQFMHLLVLQGLGSVGQAIRGNIWLYGLYGGLAAGIFEETGRFLSMKFIMKKNLTRENSLMYGAGHGGVEAILIVGVLYISNLINSVMLNTGAMDDMIAGEMGATLRASLEPLATLPAWNFYLAGVERLLAITLHIALSILVCAAASKANRIGYYFLAIGIHALVNCVVVVAASILSTVIAELICLVGVAAAMLVAIRIWKSLEPEVQKN